MNLPVIHRAPWNHRALLVLLCAMCSWPVLAQENTEDKAKVAVEAMTTPATPADQQAEQKLSANLDKEPALQKVEAEVSSGVATLSGEVPAQPDRQEAGNIAAATPGVKNVQNQIALDPDLSLRFSIAMSEAKGKLVRLVANLPLLLVAVLVVMLSVWLGGVLGRHLPIVSRISKRNPYMENLLRSIVRGVVILAGVLMALDLLGATALVGAVLGSAGVVGLVLGFAFKDIAENYVAGILLSIRRPFNPGDMVRIDSYEGRVVALTSRATQLMTADGNHLLLPNGLVFKSVMLNYSHNPKRRFDFTTNVATGRSWNKAMDIGIQTMRGIDGVLDDPAPTALIQDLANDAATLRFAGWIDQHHNDLAKTRSESMRLVRRALREAGLTPPDGVQHIQLKRDPAEAVDDGMSRESGVHRDMSVDRTLEKQLAHLEESHDLLQQPDATTPAKP